MVKLCFYAKLFHMLLWCGTLASKYQNALSIMHPGDDRKVPPLLDSIAVSAFVVILVDSDKYRIWDEQACLPPPPLRWWHKNMFGAIAVQSGCRQGDDT